MKNGMSPRRNRRGFTLLEMTVYVALAGALVATLASVEMLARRSTFYQVVALEALDDAERLAAALEEDLEGWANSAVESDGSTLEIVPSPGSDRPERIVYRLAPGGVVERAAAEDVSRLARHVGAFGHSIARERDGRPEVVEFRIEIDREIPGGTNRYRRVFEGSALVGEGGTR